MYFGELYLMYMNTNICFLVCIMYFFLYLTLCYFTRVTRRMPLVEKELLTFPEHLGLPQVFSGVRVFDI